MKLTARIKLIPTDEQRQLLHQTLQKANAACNYISEIAWENRTFNKLKLQKLCYYETKEHFDLAAQIVVRALSKVTNSYKTDKQVKREFRKHGAFPFDERILKYQMEKQLVSIWTIGGRQHIQFQIGPRQLEILQYRQGESNLAFIRGEFYLFATCDIEEPTPNDITDYLGVDLGIANIATDSDGEIISGKHVKRVRHRNQRLRQKLQKKDTKSSKRLLKKISGREQRFVKDVNHCVSKAIVKKAKRTERGIAIEDLTGIRERVRLRKSQRTQLHNWAFADLGNKLGYKAKAYGVSLVQVDPRYTSQTCSECGCIDKHNRTDQSNFSCTSCGFSLHADVNAARNIAGRVSVNRPYAVSELG